MQFCLLGGSCRRKVVCFYYDMCLLIGCSSTTVYAAVAVEVVEALIALLSISQVGALVMGVSRM
jgi:hypothetical protein